MRDDNHTHPPPSASNATSASSPALAPIPPPPSPARPPSSLDQRVNAFRGACLDCLIAHQTHHLIPHSSKVIIFDSKLKVQHAFDGLVTHDINCFPEADTRVLTDAGLLFLEQIEQRRSRGEVLLYGCYDVATKALVYRPGKLVYDTRPHAELVSFASHHEARRWSDDSGSYGGRAGGQTGGNAGSTHTALRVTPSHVMYAQLGDKDKHGIVRFTPPAKHAAHSLLSRCHCPRSAERCVHRIAHMRMLACAEGGLRREGGDEEVRVDVESAREALGLHDAGRWLAFVELLGSWVGGGSLQCCTDYTGEWESLRFGQRTKSDRAWLRCQLRACGLSTAECQSSLTSDGVEVLLVTNRPWLNWFDQTFSVKDSASPPLIHSSPFSSFPSSFASSLLGPSSLPLSPSDDDAQIIDDDENGDDEDNEGKEEHKATSPVTPARERKGAKPPTTSSLFISPSHRRAYPRRSTPSSSTSSPSSAFSLSWSPSSSSEPSSHDFMSPSDEAPCIEEAEMPVKEEPTVSSDDSDEEDDGKEDIEESPIDHDEMPVQFIKRSEPSIPRPRLYVSTWRSKKEVNPLPPSPPPPCCVVC